MRNIRSRLCIVNLYCKLLGAVALVVGSIVPGTNLNYVIFIGHFLGKLIQHPIKMT